jgi:hypothetical protein
VVAPIVATSNEGDSLAEVGAAPMPLESSQSQSSALPCWSLARTYVAVPPTDRAEDRNFAGLEVEGFCNGTSPTASVGRSERNAYASAGGLLVSTRASTLVCDVL